MEIDSSEDRASGLKEFEFRRYGRLEHLLDTLENRRIWLRSPQRWDDNNDKKGMQICKDQLGLKTLLAVCFANTSESYSHWSVFSKDGAGDGIALTFDKGMIVKSAKDAGFEPGQVKYIQIKDFSKRIHCIDQIPFSKRYAYRSEGEYRIIYKSTDKVYDKVSFRIPQEAILEIRVNPWASDEKFHLIKIKISNFLKVRVFKSTLIENNAWISRVRNLASGEGNPPTNSLPSGPLDKTSR